MQIYWNRRNRLHKKRVQLPQDWLGTLTWPPFHWFGTSIWPSWRHVKTLYKVFRSEDCDLDAGTKRPSRPTAPLRCSMCVKDLFQFCAVAVQAILNSFPCAYLPAGRIPDFFEDCCYYGNVLLDQEITLACIYFHSRDEANPLFLRPNHAT